MRGPAPDGALAWALSLGGWVALAALAMDRAPGQPLAVAMLIVAWLGAQAASAAALRARPSCRRAWCVGATASAMLGLVALQRGEGLGAVWCVALGWAGLQAAAAMPGGDPRARSAAFGAALAWVALGDYTNATALAWRLSLALPLAGLALVAAPRRAPGDGTSRIGCLLPFAVDAPWSVRLAAWSMLPMMCGLPWIANLCRGGAWPASAELALHYALMFAPACAAGRLAASDRAATLACGALLGLGGSLFIAVPTPAAWTALTLCQGAAWAVALANRAPARRPGRA